jgi:hypothetical protein
MAKENKALLRRNKGWKGFVHSYKNYIENGSYDDMKWGKGTKEPVSIETTKMGKVIIKW